MLNLLFAPAVLTAITAVGVALAWLGLRGRRSDDHPLCRQCGFDLFGKPPASTVCPECGVSLGRRRAVRVGHRQKKGRLLLVAGTWLLLAFSADGLGIWHACWSTHWIEHAPQWWLVQQAHSNDAKTRDQAIAEAARRDAIGTLTHAREALLVDEAIAHQRDWDFPWNHAWGDLVETARAGGRVSDLQWEQYLLDAITVRLTCDPLQRQCDSIYIGIARGPDRRGSGPQPPWPNGLHLNLYCSDMRMGQHAERIEFGKDNHGGEWALSQDEGVTGVGVLDSVRSGDYIDFFGFYPGGEIEKRLTLGPHTLKVKFALRAAHGQKVIAHPANRDVDLAASWTMISPPKVNVDPRYREGVEKSMGECKAQFYRTDLGVAWVYLSFHNPPIDLAWGVRVRCRDPDTGKIFESGPYDLFFGKGADRGEQHVSAIFFDSNPIRSVNHVDHHFAEVILRPSLSASPKAGVAEIWGGEITIKNVKFLPDHN
ncbi:MAG TPA: hypothetical protein VFE47_20925 [Tepidisphaeraceae bacterium]|jgi:hypothetical protein|nr:hypothetical protein [Tepidisphaeraceae bacterium]